jgi:hypothetical protein
MKVEKTTNVKVHVLLHYSTLQSILSIVEKKLIDHEQNRKLIVDAAQD